VRRTRTRTRVCLRRSILALYLAPYRAVQRTSSSIHGERNALYTLALFPRDSGSPHRGFAVRQLHRQHHLHQAAECRSKKTHPPTVRDGLL